MMAKDLSQDVQDVRARFGHLPLYRVWPKWNSSGIWMPEAIGGTPGPNLILDNFRISGTLKEHLARWQSAFDEKILEEGMWPVLGSYASFSAEGLNLAVELSRELGDRAAVEYELGEYCAYTWTVPFVGGLCVAT